ncbi:hypothetical protein G1H11_17655 [Phytoactinopolyspora alkaliphila]|uniref:Uncharacterized protein n=1 Tax=Phytoactinopolyspora alkaliphila TaxID=1783498 RepID=A0A6N9YQA5_9ACTN|nr:hypothetical protein [Phytoactinopolyspora alkaliphila]NED97127.1 hypothetical protein [Phytoactinopolyspora alkaliphila]
METGDWLALTAIIVAVMSIPIAVLATRHWGNRRARISYDIATVPMIPSDAEQGPLQISYHEIPVERPHLVTVTLDNTGPRDLTSDMFDGGAPISVHFDQTFYGLTNREGGVNTLSSALGSSGDDAVVYIKPGLLKRGNRWSFSAVVSGPVIVNCSAPLANTDFVDANHRRLNRAKWRERALQSILAALPSSSFR